MSTHQPEVSPARRTLVKVPEITLLFWVVKVLTTGMGETASDFLVRTVDPVLAVGAAGLVLGVVLASPARSCAPPCATG